VKCPLSDLDQSGLSSTCPELSTELCGQLGNPDFVVDELDGPEDIPADQAQGDIASDALASARAMMSSGTNTATRKRWQRRIVRRVDPIFSGARPDARDPLPVARVLSQALEGLGWSAPLARARVLSQWPEVVGADIAAHCQPVSLTDSVLKVDAESTAWATQLRLMAPQILARVTADLPAGTVSRIVFSGPSGPSWRRGPRSMSGGRGARDTYG
jgi:predicted nucleic acid-binding Zn ribbon protein